MTKVHLPRFSIVTIVRDNADGLLQTEASVREQVFTDFEWIIIDGASTDGTAEMVVGLGDAGAQVLSEPDTGIYNAMNKGLLRARGDYLVLLNAGDRFASSDVLNKVDAKLNEFDNPDVLYGGSYMQFPGRRIARSAKPPSYIWHGQPGLHQATYFRRQMHQRFPYDESFRITGDYDVITRMWAAERSFATCDIMMSINTFDSNSTSDKHKKLLISEAVRSQRKNLKLNTFLIAISVLRRGLVSILAKRLSAARRGAA